MLNSPAKRRRPNLNPVRRGFVAFQDSESGDDASLGGGSSSEVLGSTPPTPPPVQFHTDVGSATIKVAGIDLDSNNQTTTSAAASSDVVVPAAVEPPPHHQRRQTRQPHPSQQLQPLRLNTIEAGSPAEVRSPASAALTPLHSTTTPSSGKFTLPVGVAGSRVPPPPAAPTVAIPPLSPPPHALSSASTPNAISISSLSQQLQQQHQQQQQQQPPMTFLGVVDRDQARAFSQTKALEGGVAAGERARNAEKLSLLREEENLRNRVQAVLDRENNKSEARKQREEEQLQRDAREIDQWFAWHRELKRREEEAAAEAEYDPFASFGEQQNDFSAGGGGGGGSATAADPTSPMSVNSGDQAFAAYQHMRRHRENAIQFVPGMSATMMPGGGGSRRGSVGGQSERSVDVESEWLDVMCRLNLRVAITNMIVCEHEEGVERGAFRDEESSTFAGMMNDFETAGRTAHVKLQSRLMFADILELREEWLREFTEILHGDEIGGKFREEAQRIRQADQYALFLSCDEQLQAHLLGLSVAERERYLDELAEERYLKRVCSKLAHNSRHKKN